MAYLPSKSRARPGALGSISDVATAVRDVVEDPCLFEVAKMVSHLNDLQQSTPSSPTSPTGPRVPGIGLCSAVRPLKMITAVAERPYLAAGAAAATVALIFAFGYMAGRR